jgi:copper oxidase (laccase) domain-containing protein
MTSDNGNGQRLATFGEAALTGWRGAAGRAVAKPISRRTRFSQEQVEAAIGLALVAYAVYRVISPLIRTARAS